ncbi:MAG: hypothetical protein JM58_10385 [Peptococcaceae bacterium BICA1-8]|nr:MAG: hypothetical protein JM58_10385 [Peptococcaceae bacterium BICA1-8]
MLKEKNGVQLYSIPVFTETGLVKHGFSTRIGGISEEPFQTLNLGFHTGDDWETVKENRRLFAQSLSIPLENIVAANQVHGDKIFKAGTSDRGRGAIEQKTVVKETDALITNEPGVALIAFYADCVPIMFLDPVLKVIAIAHAGWKGTVLNISRKTVEQMGDAYSCQPENILAAICPSIGPCHYEVDTPVISQFQENFNKWERVLKLKSDGKAQLDLWEANRMQLVDAGILGKHITVSEICTYCNPELLYSYRYENGKTGRLAGIIMLNN